ncbi:MAG: diphthine--ammonia ligase [Nitrososphaerales archaeon]
MRSIKGSKALVLSSGGKDSILALHKAWHVGLRIDGIITMLPEDPESMLYHTHNVEHVEKIADCIGTEWYGFKARKKEEELSLEQSLKKLDAEVLVSGGISSKYQKDRFDKVSESANIRHFSPLWGMRPYDVLNEVLSMKLDVMIVAVAAYGLDEKWLGKHFTEESVGELLELSKKYHFDLVGEGGDIETFVLDAPLYKKRLIPLKTIKRWEKDSGTLKIQDLMVVDKG